MASDIPALKAKLLTERQVLADMVALIDQPAEQALIDAARAAYEPKAQRWTLVRDKIDRLAVVDAQIALLGP